MNIQYIHPADQIVMFMQRVYDKKLTSMSGGNLSVRDNEGNIWITPASIDKGSLTRRDIICVRPNGDCEGPHAPSSELPFHRSVYKLRPDLNAVLHAHPPALVAFSVVRRLPELNLTPTVRYMCNNIKMAAYAIPGSQALSAEVGKVFEQGCNIALLENTAYAWAQRICLQLFSSSKHSIMLLNWKLWQLAVERFAHCRKLHAK